MPVQIVQQNRDEIARLCQQYGVARLELIGSATSEVAFDPSRSDIDLLVEFEGSERLFSRYFDLKEALEQLFQRPVDLLVKRAIRNPYFQREIERQRVVLYEKSGGGTA
ncbi:MAG: nucleotidyltransferase domain-containing protein [Fimbriimonadales bacterium]|nr:nucleotidyltransferase domain-containing protein [Fimbriimonadales bacterium]